MKGLINTLTNIYKIEDLRNRILFTIGLVLIYRFGSYVVLPGINSAALDSGQGPGGILDLINIFAGGAFSRASIFALGIMPYISASIAIQLLGMAVPYFQKLQKEGESGRRKINQITRILTVVVTAAQAFGYNAYLNTQFAGAITIPAGLFLFSSVIILTSGTIFVMWLGEKITDKGIGNGISLLIMVGIVANLPGAFMQEVAQKTGDTGGLVRFIIEIAVLVFVVMATIALVQGVRKIPVQYAKRIIGSGARRMQTGGHRQYLPLKLNAAGVMPIIFAQALMFLPSTIGQFVGFDNSGFVRTFNDFTSVGYNVVYMILVVLFTYFYTALVINPVQMADDMKRNGGFIPGVKPGRRTAEFIDTVMSRITLPGSVFLGLVAIMPAFARQFGVSISFSLFFGGTSLLIMVGVVLDTLQQVESHLLMRHYDGLMKTGRIKGRGSANVSSI
jgi:preprotein translocase subunit SecY